MMVVIDNPNYKERINAGAILMDARNTHVVNCSFTKAVCDATSLARGKGNDCYNVTDDNDSNLVIWCYTATTSSNPHMIFTWKFDSDPPENHTVEPFTKIFMTPEPNGHVVNLKVSIDTDNLYL